MQLGHAFVQLPSRAPEGVRPAAHGFAHNYEATFSECGAQLCSAWRGRQISNLDYLLALNTLASRSYNDLTQYPVVPWTLASFGGGSGPRLDLTDPCNMRDLSRPMGALTGERLATFRSRWETMDPEDEALPPFLYGSHYSTAVGTVMHYLIRLHPFTRLHAAYQSGHFDVADRLFSSVHESWAANTESLTEVKELIPEFYTTPAFLTNHTRYTFGTRQDGLKVDDVVLPPWARGRPSLFIRRHREALESEGVSAALHKWVDLVFGRAQRGNAAEEADNVFFHLTYAGLVDIEAIEDPNMRRAMQLQVMHYGQTPLQLMGSSAGVGKGGGGGKSDPILRRGPHPTLAVPPQLPMSPSEALHQGCASWILAAALRKVALRLHSEDPTVTRAAEAAAKAGGGGSGGGGGGQGGSAGAREEGFVRSSSAYGASRLMGMGMMMGGGRRGARPPPRLHPLAVTPQAQLPAVVTLLTPSPPPLPHPCHAYPSPSPPVTSCRAMALACRSPPLRASRASYLPGWHGPSMWSCGAMLQCRGVQRASGVGGSGAAAMRR